MRGDLIDTINNENINNENINNEDNNAGEYYDENINEQYYNETIKDMQDLQLLQVQSQAQLILAIGYLLEYTASNQAIQVIEARMAQRNADIASGNFVNEEEKLEQDEKLWRSEGLDADKTALLAAEFELYGQIIITRLDNVKLRRLPENLNRKDLTLTKTANNEIYFGAVLELIAYILNYQGALTLYAISNEDVTID